MKAARTHYSRAIPYDAPNLRIDGTAALQAAIVMYVRGLRGAGRADGVSEAQIVKWFRATSPDFVRRQLGVVTMDGRVKIAARSLSSHRKHNGAYRYFVEAAQ